MLAIDCPRESVAVESPGGVSPPGATRTVHDPLESCGSRCPTVAPGLPLGKFALLLALTHGFMGVLTPYATTSGPVYLGSGYITAADYWRLGTLFGLIFLITLLAVSAPLVLLQGKI